MQFDPEVESTRRTLARIHRLSDEMNNITDESFLEAQTNFWRNHMWSSVSRVRMVFGRPVPEKAVRLADARVVRDAGDRMPAGMRTVLRQHDGIMIAAFDDALKLLGTFEICTYAMTQDPVVGDYGLVPCFWDYDDVPSSTIVHAVHANSGTVVAFEPPTFRRKPELQLVATSFDEWLDKFVLRCKGLYSRMPVLRTLPIVPGQRPGTGVGVGPYESDVIQ